MRAQCTICTTCISRISQLGPSQPAQMVYMRLDSVEDPLRRRPFHACHTIQGRVTLRNVVESVWCGKSCSLSISLLLPGLPSHSLSTCDSARSGHPASPSRPPACSLGQPQTSTLTQGTAHRAPPGPAVHSPLARRPQRLLPQCRMHSPLRGTRVPAARHVSSPASARPRLLIWPSPAATVCHVRAAVAPATSAGALAFDPNSYRSVTPPTDPKSEEVTGSRMSNKERMLGMGVISTPSGRGRPPVFGASLPGSRLPASPSASPAAPPLPPDPLLPRAAPAVRHGQGGRAEWRTT